MPRWLAWFLVVFIGVNALALVIGLPNPFSLLWYFFTTPAPEQRSMDGMLHGLSLVMGIGLLVAWAIVAFVMWRVMRKKK